MNTKRVWLLFLMTGFVLTPEHLHAASRYTVRPEDPAAVYLTKDYFAVGADGLADDSDALQQAIDKAASGSGFGIVFIPQGTYRLTKTVYVWPGIRLIGYGDSRPTLTLHDNTPGFQEGDGRYMVFFSGGRGPDGTPRDANPGTFYSAMSNIDFEIGSGNPAAVAIRFHVAQHSYLSHMDFRLGSARAGLEDIGNEVENLRFTGGQFGIMTKRSSPGWPILVIDCTFEGQSRAAVSSDEAGLTIVRAQFTNLPVAVSIAPNKPDQLWISDARLENIAGPALLLGGEDSARTQINLHNVVCNDVPTLARFRQSGKTINAPGATYRVEQFSHGLHITDMGLERSIKTTLKTAELAALPEPAKSDIPGLPDSYAWVNVRTLGVAGDDQTDDTAALQKAIAEHKTLYFPMGWYRVSDTLTLRPDTVLIGLHPAAAVIRLHDKTPAFQGTGSPKPVIQTPRGGSCIITGIGVYTNELNPRAVGVKWSAAADSMLSDVRFHGGHGTRPPGRQRYDRLGNRDAWNTQHASLWVTDGGGGTFKNIWTPNPHASAGMEISDTSTEGRVYAMSLEHHVRNELIIRNVSNWQLYAVQFEAEREEGPETLQLLIDRSSGLLFANTFFYRVISSFVPFPYAAKVADSKDVAFRNFHCYSNSKVSYDAAVHDATDGAEVRDAEFAVLDITGRPRPAVPSSGAVILEDGAGVEKLADGFLNISGAAVDSKGVLYFADARKGLIYRWSQENRTAEPVRKIPQQPVQLAFDRTGSLLVVAYEGNGTVLTFRPEDKDSQPVALEPQPSALRPQMTPVLPVNRWMGDAAFLRDTTDRKPFHYISPDGTTFIPAGEDFISGAVQWGVKMADVLRAFGLAPAICGRPFYVTNELELKTWTFSVAPDGTLTDGRLFAHEGGEGVIADEQGNVYIAAGRIRIFDPDGKPIDVIDVPQRPTCLIFGGSDRKTLFIAARSGLYAVRTRYPGPAQN